MDVKQRQIARLLGYPATASLTRADLQAGVLANPERISHGLVDEAFASDDVSSGADARAFVEDCIADWDPMLDAATRNRVASLASVEIQRRAPSG